MVSDISDLKAVHDYDIDAAKTAAIAEVEADVQQTLTDIEDQSSQGLDSVPDTESGIQTMPVSESISSTVKGIIPEATDPVPLEISVNENLTFKIDPLVFDRLKAIMAWCVYGWTILALAEIAFPPRLA